MDVADDDDDVAVVVVFEEEVDEEEVITPSFFPRLEILEMISFEAARAPSLSIQRGA